MDTYTLNVEIDGNWTTILTTTDLALCEKTFFEVVDQNTFDCIIINKVDQMTPLKMHIKGLF